MSIVKTIAAVSGMVLGGWMISRDINGLFVIQFRQTIVGTGLVMLSFSELLNSSSIMSDELHSKVKISSATLIFGVPSIIAVMRNYRDRRLIVAHAEHIEYDVNPDIIDAPEN